MDDPVFVKRFKAHEMDTCFDVLPTVKVLFQLPIIEYHNF